MATEAKKATAIDWQRVRERLSRAGTATQSPQRIEAILRERARHAAEIPAAPPAAGTLLEVVRFTLGGEQYALETAWVREVLRPREITPLPGTPDYLAGIANLRGQIIAVFDLRTFFNLAAPTDVGPARIIVLGEERIEFGIIAEAVREVAPLAVADVKEPPGSVTGIAREYLRGVTAEPLCLIDGAVLLKDPRLYIDMREDDGSEAAEERP